jgi:hypothetical protein
MNYPSKNATTEAQRTQRFHREELSNRLLRQSDDDKRTIREVNTALSIIA